MRPRKRRDDESDERNSDDENGKDELHTLPVAYHPPVAAEEMLLLLPLNIILKVIALNREKVCVYLYPVKRRKFL